MSLYNELPTAFPWYRKIEQQHRRNEGADRNCDYRLITPNNALLPFQFRKSIGAMPTSWKIMNVNTSNVVATLAIGSNIRKVTRQGFDYIYYNGGALTTNLPTSLLLQSGGYYYSVLSFVSGENYYSEVFFVPDRSFSVGTASIQYMRLEWWNNSDIAPIFYNDFVGGAAGKPWFSNVLYLDNFINSSEPEITEDGEKDGNGDIIVTDAKVIINYRITDLVPDYIKKALVVMQLHDYIVITTKQNVRSGEILRVNITTSTEDDQTMSNVDILFQDEIAIVKKGCAQNMV